MPSITIHMYEGRSKEKKARLHEAVAQTVSEVLDVPLDAVEIRLVDVKKENISHGGRPVD